MSAKRDFRSTHNTLMPPTYFHNASSMEVLFYIPRKSIICARLFWCVFPGLRGDVPDSPRQGRRTRNIYGDFVFYYHKINLLASHRSHESHESRIVNSRVPSGWKHSATRRQARAKRRASVRFVRSVWNSIICARLFWCVCPDSKGVATCPLCNLCNLWEANQECSSVGVPLRLGVQTIVRCLLSLSGVPRAIRKVYKRVGIGSLQLLHARNQIDTSSFPLPTPLATPWQRCRSFCQGGNDTARGGWQLFGVDYCTCSTQ